MSDSAPQRRQPTRLPHPWDSPGKNTGVGCHILLQCTKVKGESEVAQSCPTLCDPMDCSLQCRRPWFNSWVRKIPWRKARLPTPVFLGFPCDSAGNESACNAEGLGSIPGLGRSPGEGKGYPLQYSGLENSMDCIVHEVAKSQT